jgi:hypothetical protein
MLERVTPHPTALHRAAAWCAVALGFALVAAGTRSAVRALRPEPEAFSSTRTRESPTLASVDAERDPVLLGAARVDAAEPTALPQRSTRRALWAPVGEPLERHPALVIEGSVRSVSGALRQPVELRVDHPGGGTARTRLYFDRVAADGRGRVAAFKLVKPEGGTFVLRPVVLGEFEYVVEPPELRLERSTSGVGFLVRDDVPHVDLDVVALDANGAELQQAQLRWRVFRGAEFSIDDLTFGGPQVVELTSDRGPDLLHAPVTHALQCLVTAPGHRPLRLVHSLRAENRRLEVRLEAGWGVYLVDMGLDAQRTSKEPPPSGEIVVDGRRIGFTDPSGVTYVEAHATPQEFAVYFEGRRASLLRNVPTDRLVVRIDHRVLEPAGYVQRPRRD